MIINYDPSHVAKLRRAVESKTLEAVDLLALAQLVLAIVDATDSEEDDRVNVLR